MAKHSKYLLSDTAYQAIKWLDLTALPALSALVASLGSVWHWDWSSSVSATISLIAVFGGALIGISQAKSSQPDDTDKPALSNPNGR